MCLGTSWQLACRWNKFSMTTSSHDSMPAVLGRASFPPLGLGLSSVILGAIGMVLFLVPIIGISISFAGIVIGITGIVIAFLGGAASLRLSVVGVLLSGCALVIISAIALAPSGYFRPRSVFPSLS